MARTLSFSGELNWPLEDGKQAAKLNVTTSLVYTSALSIEKVYAAPVTDEAITLPMTNAKFLLLQAEGEDIEVKLNGSTAAISLKAGAGYLLVWNQDGAVNEIEVTVAVVPATLKGYAFA